MGTYVSFYPSEPKSITWSMSKEKRSFTTLRKIICGSGTDSRLQTLCIFSYLDQLDLDTLELTVHRQTAGMAYLRRKCTLWNHALAGTFLKRFWVMSRNRNVIGSQKARTPRKDHDITEWLSPKKTPACAFCPHSYLSWELNPGPQAWSAGTLPLSYPQPMLYS